MAKPKMTAGGLMSVKAVMEFTDLSEREVLLRIAKGVFPSVKLGKRRLVPRNALIEYLERQVTYRVKATA